MKRRKFLINMVRLFSTVFASVLFLKFFKLKWLGPLSPSYRPTGSQVLRPPGALVEAEFLEKCIRCQRCYDACQTDAIRLAGPFDGIGMGTPFILPDDRACDLCLSCTHACPSGALLPIDNKKNVQMGIAVVDKNRCVSHNGTGVCGACYTACPLKNAAITQGIHNAPTVHANHCVGCGLCQEVCPVEEVKAIRVFSGRNSA